MKKLLIITYYWPPSGGAGVQRWLKFVKYLPDFDCQPVVITVNEDYASYAQRDNTLQEEVDPGLKVIRTRSFEPYSLYLKLSGKKEIPFGGFTNEGKVSVAQRVFRFIRGNLFLPDPRKGWNRFAFNEALAQLHKEKFDALITTGPPHSTHLIGLKLKRKTGIKWIADFRDPWTDIYYYGDLSHTIPAKWYDRKLEKRVLLSCDKIITVGNELKKLFLSKSPLLKDGKIEVITNGYDTADFIGFDKPVAKKFMITYTGTISAYYRLETFVSAIESIPEEIRREIFIRFVGSISPEMISLFKTAGLESQFECTGYVSHETSIRYLFESSVLLLLIPEIKDNKGILTGKFFEYLASGRPILAIGPTQGDVAVILDETGAGKIFGYNDIAAIKQYMVEIYNKGDERTVTSASIENYSRRSLTGKLAELI